MSIDHVAIWTMDLERLKVFYTQYFAGTAGPLYENKIKRFMSYFITFSDGSRLELMHKPELHANPQAAADRQAGLAHLAMAVGSPEAVDSLTETLRQAGCPVVSEPRRTGDGYYESCILDPDGNRVEITA